MLHRRPQNHYLSCGCPKELWDEFADFFRDKIVTIRHQLDTLSAPLLGIEISVYMSVHCHSSLQEKKVFLRCVSTGLARGCSSGVLCGKIPTI